MDVTLNSQSTANLTLWQYHAEHVEQRHDICVHEAPLEIRLRVLPRKNPAQAKTQTWLCTMRTPGNDVALVRGLLLTSGVVQRLEDIVAIHEVRDSQHQQPSNIVLVTVTAVAEETLLRGYRQLPANSSCGVCGQQYIDQLYQARRESPAVADMAITTAQVQALVYALEQQQTLFMQTGGSHGVGLFNASAELLDVQEDIGRHNALDKLIGQHAAALMAPTKAYGIVISSRASYEIVQKAAMLHLQMVIAVGAPSSLAVELAEEMDITLLAFTRNNTFNLYCGQQRIITLASHE